MIRIKKLVLHNFMSYKDLDVELDNKGLVFLKGDNREGASANSNGAGKSALVDGISWTLFGQTVRGISSTEIVNNKIQKDCSGVITLEDDTTGSCIQVKRYQADSKRGNGLYLELDGLDVTGTDKKETQNKIGSLLNTDFDLFTNSFLFGQGILKYFADLTDADQKKVLETILNLEELDIYLKTVKAKLKSKDLSIGDTSYSILSIDSKLGSYEDQMQSLQTQHSEFETSKSDNIRLVEESIKKINAADISKDLLTIENACLELESQRLPVVSVDDKAKASLEASLGSATRKRIETEGMAKQAKEFIQKNKVEESLDDLASIAEELLGQKESLETNISNHESLEPARRTRMQEALTQEALTLKTLDDTKSKLSRFKNLDGVKECPTCNHELTGEHLEKELHLLQSAVNDLEVLYNKNISDRKMLTDSNAEAKNILVEMQGSLSTTLEDISLVTKQIESISEVEEYQTLLGDLTKRLDAIIEEENGIKTKLDMINASVKENFLILQKNSQLDRELSSLTDQKNTLLRESQKTVMELDNLNKKLEELKNSTSPFSKTIAENLNTSKTLVKDKLGHQKTLDTLNKDKAMLSFWEEAFSKSGIRSLILDSVVPILDLKANEFSKILTDGSIRIQFNTQTKLGSGELRDKFQVQVINASGAEVYRGNSGGEKRRVDLCILLALQHLAQTKAKYSLNVLFFDEPFESLDSEGQDKVYSLLKMLADKIPSVFVITHQTELLAAGDTVWTIKKEKGFSKLYE